MPDNDLAPYALPAHIDQAVRAAVMEATLPGLCQSGEGITNKHLEDGLVHPLLAGADNVSRVILVHEPGHPPVVTVGGRQIEGVTCVSWSTDGCHVLDKDGVDVLTGEPFGMNSKDLIQAKADIAQVFSEGESDEPEQEKPSNASKAPGKSPESLNQTQADVASFFTRNDV